MKKPFYCEKCGQTYLRERRPIKCKPQDILKRKCNGKIFIKILTEDDFKQK